MNKCYIASGWFSPEWLAELESLKASLDKHGFRYFSPKDEAVCEADAALDRQKAIFDGNVNAIRDCDWILCNTRNKDMGSIFEAGFAHSLGRPIVYFSAGLPPGAQFNLMLAQSGIAVCTSIDDLNAYLTRCKEAGSTLQSEPYKGSIE
jgi:nucleoside 2-deoxyribosyltransferase